MFTLAIRPATTVSYQQPTFSVHWPLFSLKAA
ncbi:hypothetical protein ACVWY2_008811 [Bradyrhizobium sp. JR6.1]